MDKTRTMAGSWAFKLIIINVIVYFFQSSLANYEGQRIIIGYFGLIPYLVIEKFFIWQVFSYMFLHGSFMHILVNMYALLIFGIPIEETWGSKKFLFYYLFTGTGAGITILILNLILGGINAATPTIGASGAVFGVLLAFGLLFPDAQILLFFILPIRAKYLVMLYGGFELYSLISTMGQSNISNIGHLGGLLFGIIYFVVINKRSIGFKSKKYRASISNKMKIGDTKISSEFPENAVFLLNMLEKIKQNGIDTMTDNEYQQINYIKIMNNDDEKICVEDDFKVDDPYCTDCENFEICLIREIEKKTNKTG